jgi:alpha-L-fucosidase 2
MRIACSRKGAVAFTAKLGRAQFSETKPSGPDALIMTGTSTGQPGDLRFEAQVKITVTGGTVSASDDTITVKDADEALIHLAAGTDYALDYAKSYKGADPHEIVTRTLSQALGRGYPDAKAAHVKDYQSAGFPWILALTAMKRCQQTSGFAGSVRGSRIPRSWRFFISSADTC